MTTAPCPESSRLVRLGNTFGELGAVMLLALGAEIRYHRLTVLEQDQRGIETTWNRAPFQD